MIIDYTKLGYNEFLQKVDSIMNSQGKSVYQDIKRGQIAQNLINSNTLIKVTSVGTTGFVLGATGSGSAVVKVTATIAAGTGNIMHAQPEVSVFQGVAATGTGLINGANNGTISFGTHYDVTVYNQWNSSDGNNFVNDLIIKNNTATLGTIYYASQWRYVVPYGGAKGV